jgi:hypothetical protein
MGVAWAIHYLVYLPQYPIIAQNGHLKCFTRPLYWRGPAMPSNRATCFECGNRASQAHHVVPAVMGGTRTIMLCAGCHARAHPGRKPADISKLTKEGLIRARARGVRLGRAPIDIDIKSLTYHREKLGLSWAAIGPCLGISPSTAWRRYTRSKDNDSTTESLPERN